MLESRAKPKPAPHPGSGIAVEPPELSVVVPLFNEAGSIEQLHAELGSSLTKLGRSFEILLIDDGSHDGTAEAVEVLAAADPATKVVRFRRNFGQTAALMAGFDLSRGGVIVTLDGDGQNDPADIGNLLAKLEEGNDVVSGWRRKRREDLFACCSAASPTA